jgi:RHS repeat-associated protein
MTSMPHLPLMRWDFKDQFQATSQQVVNNGGTPEITYYVYDASGQRVRKVTERQAGPGQTPTRMKERIYLGGFELYREYAAVTLARETLHIMDDQQRIALVETRTQGNEPDVPQQLIRYQLGNHLGSASLELDDQAQIISYEEYYPYGSTSYQAVSSQTETPKRYRYTGKERDEESGLYYHGARYYAAWLGRWTAADRLGIKDGPNLYVYVNARPTRLSDPTGHYGEGGHYYTVYFVSLAAGFDPDTAYRNAVFAQMPDEVDALDAIHQQIQYLAIVSSARVIERSPIGPYGPAIERWARAERDLVQRGLHSLTGGKTEKERNVTRSALDKATPGTMEFGFLLHRFGDAYAHSVRDDESRTYETGFGHFRHGHNPDRLHLRPELYGDYVRQLYVLLKQIADKRCYSPQIPEEVERFITEVSSIRVTRTRTIYPHPQSDNFIEVQELDNEATERAQIEKIRELSKPLLPKDVSMPTYAPETEATMSWVKYQKKATHPNFVRENEIRWQDVKNAVNAVAQGVDQ